MKTCVVCGRPVTVNAVTCSSACRQKKYRESKRGDSPRGEGALVGEREAAAWVPEQAAALAPQLPAPACAVVPLVDPAAALRGKRWKADPEYDEAEKFWQESRRRWRGP